jgi:colanic acid biosynthesis glycosyl transferase WcaI
MRILFFGINYYPELTGIGKYTGEACQWLAKQGHEVEVITTMPYYPAWQISEAYKGKLWHTELIDGVKVHRCPLYVPSKVTALKRILLELSFVLASLVYWTKALFVQKYDVVVGICPPFQLGFLPLLYSKIMGVPFIYHVQDLQIDIAHEMGMIKSQKVIGLLFNIEKYLMNKAAVVSSISEGMLRKISLKGLQHKDFWLFPNWVDTYTIKPLPLEQSLRKELGYSEQDFIVQYAGTIAEKQGLEMLIEVAHALPHIQFMLVGEGGYKQKLSEKVTDAGLKNIKFFGLQPYEKLANLLATGNIHLVLQKKSASDLVLPSKLTGILAAGACALVTAESGTSLFEVIDKNQVGILIEPESVYALVEGIIAASKQDLSIYKQNARVYAEKWLDREQIMRNFEENLKILIDCI